MLMSKKNESSVVESFADLENREIVQSKTIGEYILEIVNGNPNELYNQRTIREALFNIEGAANSNPAINGALRKLAESKLILRENQGVHAYYRAMPVEKPKTRKTRKSKAN